MNLIIKRFFVNEKSLFYFEKKHQICMQLNVEIFIFLHII